MEKSQKAKMTGDEVGRAMIEDLVEAYKNLILGKGEKGLYTASEKLSMVNSLTNPEDIRRYNEYKYIHDYLNMAPAAYESYSKTCEVYYWRLYHMLKELMDAEVEYRNQRPLIMTREQYRRFLELNASDIDIPKAHKGIAVLEPLQVYPRDDIDEKGDYVEPEPFWRANLSENFLSARGGQAREYISGIKEMLRECLARQAAVALVGEFIGIPDVSLLLNPVDINGIFELNHMMYAITGEIERRGLIEGERSAAVLKKRLKELLVPIDIDSLSPTKKAMEKAAEKLDFSTAQGGLEAFTALLKRGTDDG